MCVANSTNIVFTACALVVAGYSCAGTEELPTLFRSGAQVVRYSQGTAGSRSIGCAVKESVVQQASARTNSFGDGANTTVGVVLTVMRRSTKAASSDPSPAP
jgi:hypothetical protein